MAIFFIVLAASSPCFARARTAPSDHHPQVDDKSATSYTAASSTATTSNSSPQNMVQGLASASPLPPATEVDYPESNGYIPQGSVPSPGVGHHWMTTSVLPVNVNLALKLLGYLHLYGGQEKHMCVLYLDLFFLLTWFIVNCLGVHIVHICVRLHNNDNNEKRLLGIGKICLITNFLCTGKWQFAWVFLSIVLTTDLSLLLCWIGANAINISKACRSCFVKKAASRALQLPQKIALDFIDILESCQWCHYVLTLTCNWGTLINKNNATVRLYRV